MSAVEVVLRQKVVLGTPLSFDVHAKVPGYFRCTALGTNAPGHSFVVFDVILFGRSAMGDWAAADAYVYRCSPPDHDLPVLRPKTSVRALGHYTGFVPVAPSTFKEGEEFEFIVTAYGDGRSPAEEFAAGRILAEECAYFEQSEAGNHCPDLSSMNVAYFASPDNRVSEVRCLKCKARRKFNREMKTWCDWELDVPWGAP